jgi:hypothetical protein
VHIPTTIKTSHGPRLPPHALIRVIERDAAEAERELRFSAADHLTHRALALRAAAA